MHKPPSVELFICLGDERQIPKPYPQNVNSFRSIFLSVFNTAVPLSPGHASLYLTGNEFPVLLLNILRFSELAPEKKAVHLQYTQCGKDAFSPFPLLSKLFTFLFILILGSWCGNWCQIDWKIGKAALYTIRFLVHLPVTWFCLPRLRVVPRADVHHTTC